MAKAMPPAKLFEVFGMKKFIQFGPYKAFLSRSGRHGYMTVMPASGSEKVDKMAELADTLSGYDKIDVLGIYPFAGLLEFNIGNEMSNTDLLYAVCDAVTLVYNSDTSVS